MWNSFGGKRPNDDRWRSEWGLRVTYADHSFLTDLMNGIKFCVPFGVVEGIHAVSAGYCTGALGCRIPIMAGSKRKADRVQRQPPRR